MIYFDENKEAYNNRETIYNWGKTCIYECEDEIFNKFLDGEYVWEGNTLVLNPEWENIKLQRKKQLKIQENDTARNLALNQGVTYNNILFDSDTDQKANLLGAVLQMSDEDNSAPEGLSSHVAENAFLDESSPLPSAALSTIEWYGMNNDCLICTKQDLLNIGGLITQLHTFCWTKNAEIKEAINNAQTIEEVEGVEINYEF